MYSRAATGENKIACNLCKKEIPSHKIEVEEFILNNIESMLIEPQYVKEWDCPECYQTNRL